MFPAPDDAHNAPLYSKGEELLDEFSIEVLRRLLRSPIAVNFTISLYAITFLSAL